MTYLWAGWFALGAVAFYKRRDSVRLRNTLFLTGVFLLVCAAARVCLLASNFQVFSSLSFLQIAGAFLNGLLVDAPVFALFCGPFLLLLNLPCTYLRWQKCVLGTAFLFVGLALFALAGDIVYFHMVGRHTGADILNLVTSFSLVWLVVWKEYKWALALLAAVVAALAWMGVRLAGKSGRPRRGPWVWEACCLLFLAWTLCGAWRGFSDKLPVRRAYYQGLERGHLTQNGIFSMLYAVKPTWYVPYASVLSGHATFDEIPFADAVTETSSLLLVSKQEHTPDASYPFFRERVEFNADARGRNLIIFALESLDGTQVDALAGTSYGATPNLDGLIRAGVSFDNFYACSMASSLDGIGTLMTGVCHLGGANYFGQGMENLSVSRLGTLFTRAGYRSVFVRSTQDGWMFIGPLARLSGFETEDENGLKRRFGKKEAADEDSLMFLLEEMKKSDKPFFGFFFSLATHEPLGSFFPEKEVPESVQKFPPQSYLRALAYTDWAIGRFLAELKKSGLYENTVFVIVGDHLPRGTDRGSLREQYKVPFVISAPGVLKPGRRTEISGQADVLPTLVDLFRLSSPYAAMGNSLLDASRPEFAFVSFMGGDHFGGIVRDALVLEDASFFPEGKTRFAPVRRRTVALNRAVYDLLFAGRWGKHI